MIPLESRNISEHVALVENEIKKQMVVHYKKQITELQPNQQKVEQQLPFRKNEAFHSLKCTSRRYVGGDAVVLLKGWSGHWDID